MIRGRARPFRRSAADGESPRRRPQFARTCAKGLESCGTALRVELGPRKLGGASHAIDMVIRREESTVGRVLRASTKKEAVRLKGEPNRLGEAHLGRRAFPGVRDQ